jgi:hypothetical protein
VPNNPLLPPPACKTILICESHNRDAVTGMLTLYDIFNVFTVAGFPGWTTPFTVFLTLTGGTGSCEVTLEIHDLSDGVELLHSPSVPVAFRDRVELKDVLMTLPQTMFRHPGLYDLLARVDGQEVSRLTFRVQGVIERLMSNDEFDH